MSILFTLIFYIFNKFNFDDGIQPLEALFYTLDLINKNESLLPNITLGLIAVDSCDSPTHALDQSLIFIKGFLAHLNAFHAAEYFCPNNQASTFVGKFPSERVVGVIGGQNSAVSIQMAQLLKIFEIPQVSYLSTSPTLSNRVQFPYFYRTVPNDVTQAHAIMEILRHFNWSYVSLVYSDTEYSMKAHEKLTTMAPFYNVCFAAQYKVSYDCNASKYEEIAKKIISHPQSRVVILYTDKTYAARFFTAFKKMKRTWVDPFVFIGGDGWSARTAATHGNEAIMEGAIAVSPLARKIRGFEQYLRRLNPSTNKRNPWFGEFWQDYFRCYIQNESIPSSKSWSRPCQLGLDLKFRSISQVSFLHFVRDAAYVFAFALDSMHKDFCHGKPGLCEAMSHIDGIVLKNYIDNVSFTDESHWQFRFRDGGDGPPRYTVMNFQKDESDRYFWREIGTYFLTEQGIPLLNINMSIPRFRFYNKTFPPSVCNIYCDPKKGQLPHFKVSFSSLNIL
ncbi:hypothetical protein QYM36_007438 [Artemia franciscana]|uniref:Receptor ligand binding region domain-containing protein n=1 Tax=Artemia franciscana TaxID=6661 RepID=A0AA88ICB9_ARTSF|nr:hypothetical protein QYM36_007438 [Artemia franciscana]